MPPELRTEATENTSNREAALLHGELSEVIRGIFRQVYREMGYGFLESVYSAALACMFREFGIGAEREKPLAVYFRGIRIATFRADLVVESKILLELKAGPRLDPNAEAQIINCLRATDLEVAMLLYFGPRPLLRRFILTNDRKVRYPLFR